MWTAETVVAAGSSQKTYSPKFVAYLARLLLNFDRATQEWWQDQNPTRPFVSPRALSDDPLLLAKQMDDFEKLQASVALGLRQFQGSDGVRHLFALLKAVFGGTESGDRQLALLFSLMSDGQPTAAIAELVASTDDAHVQSFVVTDGGSGYSAKSPPLVSVTAGPASGIGDAATGAAELAPTGRLLRVDIVDAGSGYARPPRIRIAAPRDPSGWRATCRALLRNGEIDSLVLLDSGAGYTTADEPLRVMVSAPYEDPSDEPADDTAEPPQYTVNPLIKALVDPLGAVRASWNPTGDLGCEDALGCGTQRRQDVEFNAVGRAAVGTPRYTTRAESGAAAAKFSEQQRAGTRAVVNGTLDYGVSSVRVVTGGRGYGLDLPGQVVLSAPEPQRAGNAKLSNLFNATNVVDNPSRTATGELLLESAGQSRRLTSWLPATSRAFAFTDLLPSTLVHPRTLAPSQPRAPLPTLPRS